MLPAIKLGKYEITRLICGGNPFSGVSHQNPELDQEMITYYTTANIIKALKECEKNGINTLQARGDRHIMRMLLEYRLAGGKLQWIAQIASEFSNHKGNVLGIIRYEPIAIYYHGTYIDNLYHQGKIDEAKEIVEFIKEQGIPAGIGTHIPEVVEYCEENNWPVDFYMTCFYNLARGYKSSPAFEKETYIKEKFPETDPVRMCEVVRKTKKVCLAFKILAAGRKCESEKTVEEAFKFAFSNIKKTDAVVVGHFQKYKNQIKENAEIVKKILKEKK